MTWLQITLLKGKNNSGSAIKGHNTPVLCVKKMGFSMTV